MDLADRLLLFADVVDAGGFSKAAARRETSHSTVSKHLKALEAELGVLLLQRTSRTMRLTDEGRLVLAHSRRIGDTLAALRAELDDLRGAVRGVVRVSSLVHLGRHLVQPAVARFLTAHPRARVDLTLDDGPLHFSRDGLDVAVRVGRRAEGSLIARKLADNPVCLVAAPSLVARCGPPTHPAGLADMPAVAYRAEVQITRWSYLDGESIRSVEVDPVLRVDDGNALLDAVLDGLGVGYLSRFAARPHIERGALVELLPHVELPPYDPIFVIRAAADPAPPRVRVFEETLRDVAAELRG